MWNALSCHSEAIYKWGHHPHYALETRIASNVQIDLFGSVERLSCFYCPLPLAHQLIPAPPVLYVINMCGRQRSGCRATSASASSMSWVAFWTVPNSKRNYRGAHRRWTAWPRTPPGAAKVFARVLSEIGLSSGALSSAHTTRSTCKRRMVQTLRRHGKLLSIPSQPLSQRPSLKNTSGTHARSGVVIYICTTAL